MALPIRYSRPLFQWAFGDLKEVGTAVRYETSEHRRRHRVLGRGGILISERAFPLWDQGTSMKELVVVEGLSDFVAITTALPELAVIGIPGGVGPHVVNPLRRISRPRLTILLQQGDSAGAAIMRKAADLIGGRVVIQQVRGGHKVDVKDRIEVAARSGKPVADAIGLTAARQKARKRK